MKRLLGGILLGVLGLAPMAHAQGVVAGFVREDSTDVPLAGVEVLLDGSARRVLTDQRGRFVLAGLPLGTSSLLVRMLGWQPVRLRVSVTSADTAWTEVSLIRRPVQLAPVEVTGKASVGYGVREGIADRARMGFGRFIDSTVLRASEHLRVDDLLRRIPGVQIRDNGRSRIAMSTRRAGCFMQVIVDGRILYRSESPTAQDTARSHPPDLRGEYSVAELEAIEVYRSAAETPSEFNGTGAGCGTIVLWTRRGR
jgi:hypothetical protein